MSIVINGTGTISGISVGGLPDSIVDAGTLATNSVDSAELIDGAVDNSHIGALAASKLTGDIATARMPAGSIVQVVTAVNTSSVTTSATTFSDVMSVAFTPTNASNKLLIRCQLGEPDTATGRGHAICWVGSNSTEVFRICTEFGRGENYEGESHTQNIVAESDFITAASTSARTYGMAIKNNVSGTFRVGNGADHKITIMEIQV